MSEKIEAISDVKILLLIGKLRKYMFTIFVYTIDEIPASFSKLEPGAQSKLTHAYYVFPL